MAIEGSTVADILLNLRQFIQDNRLAEIDTEEQAINDAQFMQPMVDAIDRSLDMLGVRR